MPTTTIVSFLPFLFFFFFFLIVPSSPSPARHSRRTLHQPLFPFLSEPPTQAPLSSLPRYPSSTNPLPFFPAFPSPPPPPPPPPLPPSPPATSVPIFPSNEVPLIFPSPHSASGHRFLSKTLILAIAVPVFTIALLGVSCALFSRLRRRRLEGKPSTTESHRLFLASAAASEAAKATGSSVAGSSDFFYLAAARGGGDGVAAPLPLSSPELRPLPPLPHRLRQGHGHTEIAPPSEAEEEEFYSPRASSADKEKNPGESGSRRSFPSALMEKCGLPSSALSSPSCPSSYSASSPSPSSPEGSLLPSPPPRAPPPPPPPPPPPALRLRERKGSRRPAGEPPVLTSPRPSGMISMAAIHPAESPKSSTEEAAPRPKLKPLHWDKVKASSDRAMVWDQLKTGSFQFNEEMMEALFAGAAAGRAAPPLPSPGRERRLLDPKKSQNVAILLRVLNLTKEEVCGALLEGDAESLGPELLETLLKMAPTGVEEARLRAQGDDDPSFKLDPAERFLKAVLDIPFAFKRLEAMLYTSRFDCDAATLCDSFQTLRVACEELRGSRMFLRLLEAVLKTGNRMNVGTSRGGARAFKLDALLKLADVKGADGRTTLLHFVVQEIVRAEGARLAGGSAGGAGSLREELQLRRVGLQVVAGLGGELSNVKRAAAMDVEELRGGAAELAGGAGKVREVLRLDGGGRFRDAMEGFLKRAEDEITRIRAEESAAFLAVKATAEYFHGEEAHPLRIFVVVRDFLAVLDRVCKEVGSPRLPPTAAGGHPPPVAAAAAAAPGFPRFYLAEEEHGSGSP
ncbi:unnamed protein product [Spirodela intermedia]|uniref:Formin-like protein n=1 Tax=Spirodela intermedia TaxID=51605 RepID=A0A7I8L3S9_SPIIN|nr:unnamed protein product [Spirodela intermedia]